jgi:hypothetical protein
MANALGNPFHNHIGAAGEVAERGAIGDEEIRKAGGLDPFRGRFFTERKAESSFPRKRESSNLTLSGI